MNSVTETPIEVIRLRCAEMASEMQCPLHQQNARIILDSEEPERLEIEIFCCCDRFSKRVCAAVQEQLNN